jgi:hypothetical protein
MTKTAAFQKAIQVINDQGVLLVFPVNNAPEPASIWSAFHPRTKMKWEWSDDGDDRVARMWGLMKTLSDCKDVVYSKWYRGRATFFSRDLFTALLASKFSLLSRGSRSERKRVLSPTALEIFEALETTSPLSTKELKKATGLQGKIFETQYQRAMKELFENFLIVGFGEVDDGAFPSLAVGATQLLYEDLCRDARALTENEWRAMIARYMPTGSKWGRFLGPFSRASLATQLR